MARYDQRTALVVVDVQNDFAEPAGSLYVAGGAEVVEVANREIRQAVEAGALVVFTQDRHPPDTPHFAKDGGTWPVHCVAGTWGAEPCAGLELAGPVVAKGEDGSDGYSGFSVRDPTTGGRSGTGLAELLREHAVERLVVLGLATDYCVKETVLDALRLGWPVTVLEDGIRAVDLQPGDGARAEDEMRTAGARFELG